MAPLTEAEGFRSLISSSIIIKRSLGLIIAAISSPVRSKVSINLINSCRLDSLTKEFWSDRKDRRQVSLTGCKYPLTSLGLCLRKSPRSSYSFFFTLANNFSLLDAFCRKNSRKLSLELKILDERKAMKLSELAYRVEPL